MRFSVSLELELSVNGSTKLPMKPGPEPFSRGGPNKVGNSLSNFCLCTTVVSCRKSLQRGKVFLGNVSYTHAAHAFSYASIFGRMIA